MGAYCLVRFASQTAAEYNSNNKIVSGKGCSAHMRNKNLETDFLGESKKIRCLKCGKLLAKNKGAIGAEIKCVRCGTLNRILEGMIEQVIITDKRGIILFVNKAVEIATGYSADESIGKKPSELWGGCMPREFYADMWKKMLEKKESIKLKMTNKKKSGEPYDIELLVSPISDTTGEVIFFVGIEVVV
jgi:PAS domain S-box-containing protein